MALATMQKGNLVEAEQDVHGRISKASVELHGVTVTRVKFGPGARWSEDLKAYRAHERENQELRQRVQDTIRAEKRAEQAKKDAAICSCHSFPTPANFSCRNGWPSTRTVICL